MSFFKSSDTETVDDQAVQQVLSSQFDLAISTTFALENSITLYHGDCIEFLRMISDESVQLVVTSPPYNIGRVRGCARDRGLQSPAEASD